MARIRRVRKRAHHGRDARATIGWRAYGRVRLPKTAAPTVEADFSEAGLLRWSLFFLR